MKPATGEPDRFEVVNGPEDGTAFHITRTPFDIGADPGCAVSLRLDPDLRRVHARVTVVAEGYRVRRLGNAGVWVNGRRAGLIRSRILRNGGVLRVGRTDLYLVAAPDGLASRSYGMPFENDFLWAARLLLRQAGGVVPGIFRFLQDSLGGSLKFILPLVVLLFVIEYFWPGILVEARHAAANAWYTLRHWVTMMTGF